MLPVPTFALSIALGGEMARELALAGQRVIPLVAERTGYRFAYRDLGSALAHVLARAS
jgi:NAD dependent epimerase/dehydratase family enzyme